MLSKQEFQRRHDMVRKEMEEEGYKALVFAANSYVSHKGSLRYLFGYNLQYRRGFAVFPLNGDPILILPEDAQFFLREKSPVIETAPIISGTSHFRLGSPAHSVVEILKNLTLKAEQIGLIHADEIMHAGDYGVISSAFSDGRLRDASDLFERVRKWKSSEEIDNLRDANRIAEKALNAVKNIIAPGKLERQVGAEAYRAAFSEGTSDTLFLTWRGRDGLCSSLAGLPTGDYEFRKGDVLIFSVELDNPAGFFVELSRIYCLGEPSKLTRDQIDTVISALHLAEEKLKPGISGGDFFRAVNDLVASRGYKLMHIYQGHSIGQDIVERPYIRDTETWTFEEGMAVAFHPFVADQDGKNAAYMANTYLVTQSGGEPFSSLPLEPTLF